jgi:hypothetical protein
MAETLMEQLVRLHSQIMIGLDTPGARRVLGDFGSGFMKVAVTLGAGYLATQIPTTPTEQPDLDDEEASDGIVAARELLGVADDATVDQIRAALRDKLRDSRLHPDQGGDGKAATELINARNLLIECAKAHGGVA